LSRPEPGTQTLAEGRRANHLDIKMNTVAQNAADPQLDADTAAALRMWVVMTRAWRAVAEHGRRQVEARGLRPMEVAVLEALHHKGPLTQGQIGEHILLTSGSITAVVDKLEQRGLVVRRSCAEDRRIVYAELTEAGGKLIAMVFPEHAEVLRSAMAGLTTEEKQMATVLLRRLGRHAAEQP
jgi:MarR family 2-MHQ and catechol resistance regulon transcriptional repressor